MSSVPATRPGGSAEPGELRGPARLLLQMGALLDAEMRKLRHDPVELLMRGVQPALWLGIFGEAMSRLRAMPTGGYSYLAFMTPGILAQSVVFIAIFYGLTIIWERDLGLLQKFLTAPVPRWALMLGKMLSAGIRGISQVVIIALLALILGIPLSFNPVALMLVVVTVVLGAAFFAGLSMTIASLVKTRERFMGIGQVITMPLFFASSALYPIAIMPPWLQLLARVNPLSYMVEALRQLLLSGRWGTVGGDLGVLLIGDLVMLALCSWLYPRAAV